MSINKNFVVKNGLEVNSNLILADADTNRVGIGTSIPEYTLNVYGGIGATDVRVTGVATVLNQLQVGTGGTVLTALGLSNLVGVGTAIPAYLLDIRSPVSTGQTALYVQGDVIITGDLSVGDDISFDELNARNINVTGIATINELGVTGFAEISYLEVTGVSTFTENVDINSFVDISADLNVSGLSTLGGYVDINDSVDVSGDLNVSGIVTSGSLSIGSTQVLSSGFELQNIASLDATTTATIEAAISNGPNTFTDLTVSGVSTFVGLSTFGDGIIVTSGISTLGITTATDLTAESVNVSGIGTIAIFESSDATITNLSGTIGTITTLNGTDVNATNAYIVTGVATNFSITDGTITNLSGTIGTITTLSITDSTITNLSGTIGTIGGVQISSGIITASSGIVTYYGDGQYLENLPSNPNLQTVLDTGNTATIGLSVTGIITATGFSTSTGTSSQFLKADGSVDANTYLQNVVEDITPQLGGNLDVNGNDITGTGQINIVGIITATSFTSSGDINANGNVVGDNSTNISGINSITAITYYGDGSNLDGISGGLTISDDTSTNSTFYPTFTSITSGIITSSSVSSTKLTFNPSTGTLAATDLNSTSDVNLKKDIEVITDAIEIIEKIDGVRFRWKENDRKSIGVIAQEVEKVLPELVLERVDDGTKSVNYSGLMGVLIQAVKEINIKISDIENRLS